jgi:ABC-type branched-subunit amino acid transport system substrate-binding protein
MRWRALVIAVLAATVTVATAVPASLANRSAAPAIKLGLIAPQGTTVANDPGSIPAIKAAIRALNARGGLNRRPVELVYCNDRNDAATGTACARRMVSSGVVAMVGGLSLVDNAINAVIQEAGIPWIGLQPNTGETFNAKNQYLLGGGSVMGFNVAVAYAGHQGWKVAALIADNPTGLALADGLKQIYTSSKGTSWNMTKVPATTADYAPLVAAAGSGNPDAALTFLGLEQGNQFITAAEAQRPFKTYIRVGLNPKYAVELGTKATDKVLNATNFPPLSSQSRFALVRQYLRDMRAEAKAGDKDVAGALGADGPFNGWHAAQVIERLSKQMRTITPKTLTAALNATKNMDFGGVIPAWTPNKPGPTGLARISNTAQFLIGYRNGRPYLLVPRAVSLEDAIAGKF